LGIKRGEKDDEASGGGRGDRRGDRIDQPNDHGSRWRSNISSDRREECIVFAWFRKTLKRKEHGFTLIELVVVLAILGILIALAVPRYLAARKKAYKAEADNILQETKTLEWAYYQQYNTFDSAGTQLGLAMPSGAHWNTPAISGGNTNVTITMSGLLSPLAATDSVFITLSSDGSSTGGSTF
jgi:prepilin-type N-terminal cleavage/methylation domain-containing protein